MVVLKAQKRRERDGSFSALPVGDDPKSEVRGSTAEVSGSTADVSGTNTTPKLRSIVAATDLSGRRNGRRKYRRSPGEAVWGEVLRDKHC